MNYIVSFFFIMHYFKIIINYGIFNKTKKKHDWFLLFNNVSKNLDKINKKILKFIRIYLWKIEEITKESRYWRDNIYVLILNFCY